MTSEQPEKLDLRSHTIADDKKQELLQLFPEIRTEGGKIDFERLKLALGETVDVGRERYGMNWPGKADCFKTIQQPSMGTLLPCPEESWPPLPFAGKEKDVSRRDAEAQSVEEKEGGGKNDSVNIDKSVDDTMVCTNKNPSSSSSAFSASPRETNSSENLIIEGDNLEVLKLLQKSYL